MVWIGVRDVEKLALSRYELGSDDVLAPVAAERGVGADTAAEVVW